MDLVLPGVITGPDDCGGQHHRPCQGRCTADHEHHGWLAPTVIRDEPCVNVRIIGESQSPCSYPRRCCRSRNWQYPEYK